MANTPDTLWEQQIIEKLLLENLKEQRRRRRWGIFFKLLFFTYIGLMLWLALPDDFLKGKHEASKKHVALIDLKGIIRAEGPANADNIATSLHDAFADPATQAVILRINSPGGSPVQANYMFNELRRLQIQHPHINTYAVCSDICASGAYYVAAAAQQIYADPASLVGSIGVLMDGFGFVDTLQKLGIQRRLLTAGDHKAMLDPFSPLKPADQQIVQSMLDDVHQQFINSVKIGRGSRLKDSPDLFSGRVWTGQQALPLGLIDGLGSVGFVAREIIKNDTIVNYTVKPNYLEQIANRFSASFSHSLSSELGLTHRQLQE